MRELPDGIQRRYQDVILYRQEIGAIIAAFVRGGQVRQLRLGRFELDADKDDLKQVPEGELNRIDIFATWASDKYPGQSSSMELTADKTGVSVKSDTDDQTAYGILGEISGPLELGSNRNAMRMRIGAGLGMLLILVAVLFLFSVMTQLRIGVEKAAVNSIEVPPFIVFMFIATVVLMGVYVLFLKIRASKFYWMDKPKKAHPFTMEHFWRAVSFVAGAVVTGGVKFAYDVAAEPIKQSLREPSPEKPSGAQTPSDKPKDPS